MNKAMKILIIIALVIVVGIVIAIKQHGKNAASAPVVAANSDTVTAVENLPRLVDLGAGKCIPCKLMKPILDELKQEYKEQFKVVFIDVWENPDEAKKYKINIIPTQIFYDASGEELFRHEGFMSKEDILSKWMELGIDLERR